MDRLFFAERRRAGGVLVLLGGLGIAAGSLGCGMITAVTNPSAAFAIQEPAHLSVVVRRAEIARARGLERAR